MVKAYAPGAPARSAGARAQRTHTCTHCVIGGGARAEVRTAAAVLEALDHAIAFCSLVNRRLCGEAMAESLWSLPAARPVETLTVWDERGTSDARARP